MIANDISVHIISQVLVLTVSRIRTDARCGLITHEKGGWLDIIATKDEDTVMGQLAPTSPVLSNHSIVTLTISRNLNHDDSRHRYNIVRSDLSSMAA